MSRFIDFYQRLPARVYTQTVDADSIYTLLPHSSFGNPERGGCLNGVVRGTQVEIACNECGRVVLIVSAVDLQSTLDRIELTLDVASAKCPHCGAVHLAPGFPEPVSFVRENCGSSVTVK